MHTVELLDQALKLAGRIGYAIRQEWLAGVGGGGCELRGQKLLFLDLDLRPDEQLEQVLTVLGREPDTLKLPMPHELSDLLKLRKTA
jgi:hypothetical protein